MFNRKSTNADIHQHDWARRDRATLLHSLHAVRLPRTPAGSFSGWGTDVAGTDPRSVHAYLSGKGDMRTTWWSMYCAAYMTVVPRATLERAMFSFHRLHHAFTLARLGIAHSVAQTAADIQQQGMLVAVSNSAAREMKR